MKSLIRLLFLASFNIIVINDIDANSSISPLIASEEIVISHDKPYYSTEENIFFSIFHSSADQNNKSGIAYILLLNESGEELFKAKVPIEKGCAKGSIFIPKEYSTGIYYLVAFTKPMLSISADNFAHATLQIYNIQDADFETPKQKKEIQIFPEYGDIQANIFNKVYFELDSNLIDYKNFQAALIETTSQDTLSNISPLILNKGYFNYVPSDSLKYSIKYIVNNRERTVNIPQAKIGDYIKWVKDKEGLRIRVGTRNNYKGDSVCVGVWQNNILQAKIKLAVDKNLKEASMILPNNYLEEGLNLFCLFDDENNFLTSNYYIMLDTDNYVSFNIKDSIFSNNAKIELPINLTSYSKELQDNVVDLSVSIRKDFSSQNLSEGSYNINSTFLQGAIGNNKYLTSNYSTEQIEVLLRTKFHNLFSIRKSLSTSQKSYPAESKELLIMEGQLLNSETNTPFSNRELFVSIYSQLPELKITKTDKNGRYNFFFRNTDSNLKIVIKPFDTTDVKLINRDLDGYIYDFNPDNLLINNHTYNHEEVANYLFENLIIKRNYFIEKSIAPLNNSSEYRPFFDEYNLEINLQEYALLNDFKEIVKELVPALTIRKVKGEEFIFVKKVDPIQKYYYHHFSNTPLVLINGVYLSNTQKLFNLDPAKITHLRVVNEQVGFDGNVFDGLVELETLESMDNVFSNESFIVRRPERLLISKDNTFTGGEVDKNIPNFDEVIYWNPNITLKFNQDYTLEFNTNDGVGRYVIELVGKDKSGNVVYFEKPIYINAIN